MYSIIFCRPFLWVLSIGLVLGLGMAEAGATDPQFAPQPVTALPVVVSILAPGAAADFMLQYNSVFSQYQKFTVQRLVPWRISNDTVKVKKTVNE